ncbi:MAG: hypothetical protein R2867_38005 [Caldilineaceae bacterium]
MLEKVVIDKQVVIGAGAVVGTGDETGLTKGCRINFAGISVVGKNAYIPSLAQIGRNVLINSGREEQDFPVDKIVADGKTV